MARLIALIGSDGSNAAKTDQQVFDWLFEGVATTERAQIGDYYRIFQAAGVDAEMETALAGGDAMEKKISQQFVRMVRQFHLQDVDVSLTKFQAGMSILVASSNFPSMTADVKAQVDALMQVPRWQHPDNQPLLTSRGSIITIPTLELVVEARI